MREDFTSQIRLDTILVTGATGFTGGCLAQRLMSCGANVRILVRPRSPNRAQISRCGFNVVEGDLINADDVHRAAEGVNRIFHVAALYRNARYSDSYYHKVNVEGTQNIITAAHACGVSRVVHCSTAGVHGEVLDIPATETSPLNPDDIYQRTKLEGETRFAEEIRSGFPGVICRPVGIYGPGDLRFLKLFKAIQQRQFVMFGSGEVLYHLTYIDDLIDGLLLCGYHSAALGEIYLLAGPHYATLNDIVTLIADILGARPPNGHLPVWPLTVASTACETICRAFRIEPPLHRRRIDFFRKNRAFSIAKARHHLGYEPRVDLPDGLSRTAAWYKERGYLADVPAEPTIRTRI